MFKTYVYVINGFHCGQCTYNRDIMISSQTPVLRGNADMASHYAIHELISHVDTFFMLMWCTLYLSKYSPLNV
jgi:hypothetical protein